MVGLHVVVALGEGLCIMHAIFGEAIFGPIVVRNLLRRKHFASMHRLFSVMQIMHGYAGRCILPWSQLGCTRPIGEPMTATRSGQCERLPASDCRSFHLALAAIRMGSDPSPSLHLL